MIRPVCIALAALALCTTGCNRRSDAAKHPVSWQREVGLSAVRRVVVLPAAFEEEAGRSAESLDATIATALRDRNQQVVLRATGTDLPADLAAGVRSDRIEVDSILALRDRFRADAILIAHCHRFRGYDPVALSLTLHLISCHDGSVLWSASGDFDGARATVQADLASWYRHRQADSGNSVQTWRLALQSPSLFSRYAADRLFRTMEGAVPEPTKADEPAVAKVEARVVTSDIPGTTVPAEEADAYRLPPPSLMDRRNQD